MISFDVAVAFGPSRRAPETEFSPTNARRRSRDCNAERRRISTMNRERSVRWLGEGTRACVTERQSAVSGCSESFDDRRRTRRAHHRVSAAVINRKHGQSHSSPGVALRASSYVARRMVGGSLACTCGVWTWTEVSGTYAAWVVIAPIVTGRSAQRAVRL